MKEKQEEDDGKKMEKANKIVPDAGDEQNHWPSLYLHNVQRPSYPLYKVDFKPKTVDHPHPIPSPCRIKLLNAKHDMSFAAVSSRRRSWIVGVGGREPRPNGGPGETLVFDCKSERVAMGPRPMSFKFSPIVFSVGDKVYALSRMPSLHLMQTDLPPWFEMLDLSGASLVNGKLSTGYSSSWWPLPPPPLFPIFDEDWTRLDSGPPIVMVESYAVVGNFILLSIVRDPFTERDAGTVAFDVCAEEWHYVDRDRNLPFIGQAFPCGDHLFLASSRSADWHQLAGFNISVTKQTNSSSLMLSIVEVPVIADATAANNNFPAISSGEFLSLMGSGVICTVGCCIYNWDSDEDQERDNICIDFYGPINVEEEDAESQRAGKIVVPSNRSEYFFRLNEPVYKLKAPTLVSAMWMDAI
nr:unnamed protein product [Digitaria exilis]